MSGAWDAFNEYSGAEAELAKRLDAFIEDHNFDAKAIRALKALEGPVLREVLDQGPIKNHPNESACVVSRILDARKAVSSHADRRDGGEASQRIFVGALPRDVTKDELVEYFSREGPAQVDFTHPKVGYCFVTFAALGHAKYFVETNYAENRLRRTASDEGHWVDCKYFVSRHDRAKQEDAKGKGKKEKAKGKGKGKGKGKSKDKDPWLPKGMWEDWAGDGQEAGGASSSDRPETSSSSDNRWSKFKNSSGDDKSQGWGSGWGDWPGPSTHTKSDDYEKVPGESWGWGSWAGQSWSSTGNGNAGSSSSSSSNHNNNSNNNDSHGNDRWASGNGWQTWDWQRERGHAGWGSREGWGGGGDDTDSDVEPGIMAVQPRAPEVAWVGEGEDAKVAVFVPDKNHPLCVKAEKILFEVTWWHEVDDDDEDKLMSSLDATEGLADTLKIAFGELEGPGKAGEKLSISLVSAEVTDCAGGWTELRAIAAGFCEESSKMAFYLAVAVSHVATFGSIGWEQCDDGFTKFCESLEGIGRWDAYSDPGEDLIHVRANMGKTDVGHLHAWLDSWPRPINVEIRVKDDQLGLWVDQETILSPEWPLQHRTIGLLDERYVLQTFGTEICPWTADQLWAVRDVPVSVHAGLDLDSPAQIDRRFGDLLEQAGQIISIKTMDARSTENLVVLRMAVAPYGWVTLAEFSEEDMTCLRWYFHRPFDRDTSSQMTWQRLHREAFDLDGWLEVSADLLGKYMDAQEALKQRLKDCDSNVNTLDLPEVKERNEARDEALAKLEDFFSLLGDTKLEERSWRFDGDRLKQVQALRGRLEELRVGAQYSPAEEIKKLKDKRNMTRECHRAVGNIKHELENLLSYEEEEDGHDPDRILELEDDLKQAREKAQKADRDLQKRMSEASKMATEHAPEMVMAISSLHNKDVKKALHMLKNVGQARIQQVLAMDRNLHSYDQRREEMRLLSKPNARHKILEGSFQGMKCVLKFFDTESHTSIPDFLKEVVMHEKLKSSLIVPLQCAFLDGSVRAGILHFKRYKCDMQQWAERGNLPISEVCNHSCVMTQSVAYIHSKGVVHGDLKPSNWLYDEETDRPLLSDFETSKDRGTDGVTCATVGATTTAARGLHTRSYAPPEVVANPNLPKSRSGDVFSLGLSLRNLHDLARGATPNAPLFELVEKMTCQDPERRIAAKDAHLDPAFQQHGATGIDDFSKVPVYWTNLHPFRMEESNYMKDVVQNLINTTTCWDCQRYGLAHTVRVKSVTRIENRGRWESFSNMRKEMTATRQGESLRPVPNGLSIPEASLDKNVNEVILWHGLPAEKVPAVAHWGLDNRVANFKGLYGAGTYMTPQWCKALQYSRAAGCSIRNKQCGRQSRYRCNCQGPKKVLLCRALMGDPYFAQPCDHLMYERRPPQRPGSEGEVYDSVIAEPGVGNNRKQSHYEMVVFERNAVYPEFVVELEW